MAMVNTYQISQECKSRFFYLPFTSCPDVGGEPDSNSQMPLLGSGGLCNPSQRQSVTDEDRQKFQRSNARRSSVEAYPMLRPFRAAACGCLSPVSPEFVGR